MTESKWIIGIDEAGRGPLAGPVAVGLVAMPTELHESFDFAKLGVRDSKKLTEKKREEWHAWVLAQAKPESQTIRKLDPEALLPDALLPRLWRGSKAVCFRTGSLYFVVSLVSARAIDDRGIVPAIRAGINNCFKSFEQYLVTGSLSGTTSALQSKSVTGSLSNSDADTTEKHPKVEPSDVQVLLDGGLRAPEEYTNQTTIIRGDESEAIISLASIMAKVTRDRHMVSLAQKYPGYSFDVHKGYGTKAHYAALAKHGLSLEHRKSFCKRLELSSR